MVAALLALAGAVAALSAAAVAEAEAKGVGEGVREAKGGELVLVLPPPAHG